MLNTIIRYKYFFLLFAFYHLALAIYGILIDEPYWRAVGHYPNTYDFLSWFLIMLSSPSSALARYFPFYIYSDIKYDSIFIAQHMFWLCLSLFQWLMLLHYRVGLGKILRWWHGGRYLIGFLFIFAILRYFQVQKLIFSETVSFGYLFQPINILGAGTVLSIILYVTRKKTDRRMP